MSERRNPTSDPLIAETEQAAAERGTGGRAMQAANLFDLRRIIGGLFVVLGLLLTVLGLTDSEADIQRAAGLNINLLTGLGMLAFGLLFLVWAFTRPLGEQLVEAEAETGPPDAGTPRDLDAGGLSDQGGGRPGDDGEGARRAGDPRRE